MNLVVCKRDVQAVTAVACLCSQSFGSDVHQSAGDRADSPVSSGHTRLMATEVSQQRLDAYKTLAAAREVLAAVCDYSAGISLSSVVETTAQAFRGKRPRSSVRP